MVWPQLKKFWWIICQFLSCCVFFYCCMDVTFKTIVENGGKSLDCGKFICYLRFWILMPSYQALSKVDFWDNKPFNQRTKPCHFKLNDLIKNITVTKYPLSSVLKMGPPYLLGFCLGGAWNGESLEKIYKAFLSSWIICLNISMSTRFQQSTFPGKLFCPY